MNLICIQKSNKNNKNLQHCNKLSGWHFSKWIFYVLIHFWIFMQRTSHFLNGKSYPVELPDFFICCSTSPKKIFFSLRQLSTPSRSTRKMTSKLSKSQFLGFFDLMYWPYLQTNLNKVFFFVFAMVAFLQIKSKMSSLSPPSWIRHIKLLYFYFSILHSIFKLWSILNNI